MALRCEGQAPSEYSGQLKHASCTSWFCAWPRTVTATYPLGGRNSEAVFLHVEATGEPHLLDEVQVFPVLCLPALPPAVFPSEVEKAAW